MYESLHMEIHVIFSYRIYIIHFSFFLFLSCLNICLFLVRLVNKWPSQISCLQLILFYFYHVVEWKYHIIVFNQAKMSFGIQKIRKYLYLSIFQKNDSYSLLFHNINCYIPYFTISNTIGKTLDSINCWKTISTFLLKPFWLLRLPLKQLLSSNNTQKL